MPQALRKTLGQHIRLARAQRRWSQEALALTAGLNRSHVGAIERGEVSVEIDTLAKLATALETTPGQLLDGHTLPSAYTESERN